jgi:hypothetical protein
MMTLRSMLRQVRRAVTVSLLAAAVVPATRAAEESCIVVLRNGGVLEGAVTVEGERYVVSAPNRSIDVPAAHVQLVAPTMEAAYEQQRDQLSNDTTDPHLRLAEWCLRYNLLTPAAEQIAAARAIDPRDPRLGLLDRRLSVIQKSATASVAGAGNAGAVAHEENASKAELRELEEATHDLPKVALERFTRKVQPLLVNNCTAAGCHQSGGAQKFQLDRAVLHGLGNRRITLRNLSATLELVDRDLPERSALLTMSRRTHGGMDHAAFGIRQQTQLKQLAEWVDLVAGRRAAPAAFDEFSAHDATPIQFPDSPALETIPSKFLDRPVSPAQHVEEPPSAALHSEVQYGAVLRTWQPKDEFDPEIFNRAGQDRTGREGDSP